MPHAVFESGTVSSTGDVAPTVRQLIPGIEPGGALAGRTMKRVLLIRDLYGEIGGFTTNAVADVGLIGVRIKLSQEEGLDPGLLLPVINMHVGVTATASLVQALEEERFGHHMNGTLWAPAFLGLNLVLGGNVATAFANVHLDYDVILVPWMDYMIMWDFLDNVVNNEFQF